MAKVWQKIRPGYTFHHPNGSAIQHSLPAPDGSTEVKVFGRGGGSTLMDGPFFELAEDAVATAPHMFEDPTAEELEILKAANPDVVKDPTPEEDDIKTAKVETKVVTKAPADKEVKAGAPAKKRGRPKKKATPKD